MSRTANELIIAQGGVRIPASAAQGKLAISDSAGNITWGSQPTASQDLLWAVTANCLAVPYPRNAPGAWAATIALVSGTVRIMGGFVLPAGVAIGHVKTFYGSTAAVTPTHQWVCFLDTSANVLATGTDQTTAAIGANSQIAYPISYTPTVDKAVYVGLLVTAGTMPTAMGLTGLGTLIAGTPIMAATGQTGVTTPGTLTTPQSLSAELGAWPYFEVYA